jgi:hypothetical protein
MGWDSKDSEDSKEAKEVWENENYKDAKGRRKGAGCGSGGGERLAAADP